MPDSKIIVDKDNFDSEGLYQVSSEFLDKYLSSSAKV